MNVIAADQVWEILLTLMVQTIKKEILAIKTQRLGGYAKSNDFKVGKLGNNTTTWYVSEFIYTISGEILADSEDSDEICHELRISSAIVLSSLSTTNLLIICVLCNFFICKYLDF